MRLFKKMHTYIFENEFKINYINNKLNIVNYTEIKHFDNDNIIINDKEKQINIKGKNLVVSKLMSNELLIEGYIKQIEFR